MVFAPSPFSKITLAILDLLLSYTFESQLVKNTWLPFRVHSTCVLPGETDSLSPLSSFHGNKLMSIWDRQGLSSNRGDNISPPPSSAGRNFKSVRMYPAATDPHTLDSKCQEPNL